MIRKFINWVKSLFWNYKQKKAVKQYEKASTKQKAALKVRDDEYAKARDRFINAEDSCKRGERRLCIQNSLTGEVLRIGAMNAAYIMQSNPDWTYTTKGRWRKYRKKIFNPPMVMHFDKMRAIKRKAELERKWMIAKPKINGSAHGFRQHIQTIRMNNGKVRHIMHTTKPQQELEPEAPVEKSGFLFTKKKKAA